MKKRLWLILGIGGLGILRLCQWWIRKNKHDNMVTYVKDENVGL